MKNSLIRIGNPAERRFWYSFTRSSLALLCLLICILIPVFGQNKFSTNSINLSISGYSSELSTPETADLAMLYFPGMYIKSPEAGGTQFMSGSDSVPALMIDMYQLGETNEMNIFPEIGAVAQDDLQVDLYNNFQREFIDSFLMIREIKNVYQLLEGDVWPAGFPRGLAELTGYNFKEFSNSRFPHLLIDQFVPDLAPTISIRF